jgi:hypothetical protein
MSRAKRRNSGDFEEILSGPGLRIVHRGRYIYVENTRTPEEHRAQLQSLLNGAEEAGENIEKQVQELEIILAKYEPFDIIGNILLANSILNPETYKEYEHIGSPAYTEFICLLYLTKSRDSYPKVNLEPIPGSVLEDIQQRTITLFQDQIFHLAFKDIDPSQTGNPDILSELRFKLLSQSLVVRFHAYPHHIVDLLKELFAQLNNDITRTLGFNIEDALTLADGVESLVTHRMVDRRDRAHEFEKALRKAVKVYRHKKKVAEGIEISVLQSLATLSPHEAAKRIEHIVIAWTFYGVGTTFSFTAEELSTECGVALETTRAFLNTLALGFGDVEATYRHPAPTHPLMLKSFIRVDERFFCPGWDRIAWNLRPVIEATWNPDVSSPKATDRTLWTKYEKIRAEFLENKALAYLGQALRHAQVYKNLFYDIDDEGTQRRVELDGLIILDTAIFLVEAKAGTASPPLRRGAKKRMLAELDELVGTAYQQAVRAKRYINETAEPKFGLTDGSTIIVPKQALDRVFLVTVTLEYLDAMVTNTYKLRELGLFATNEFPWCISLTDLRVICELTEFPSQLVHYLDRRGRINEQGFLEAPEELDLFGHYLAEGLYFDDPEPDDKKPMGVNLMSYTGSFDDFYMYETGQRQTPAPKPTQVMPDVLRAILSVLETRHPAGYLHAACTLLDMDGEARDTFAVEFIRMRSQAVFDGLFHDMTQTFGAQEFGITVMFATAEKSLELSHRLRTYCELKKYQQKCGRWIGLGCVADSQEIITHMYVTNNPWVHDDKTEALVEKFFPSVDAK